MAGLEILSKVLHRKSNILNNLCISLAITLIHNPYNITNISVLLSYGGVIRNNSFRETIKNLVRQKNKTKRKIYRLYKRNIIS